MERFFSVSGEIFQVGICPVGERGRGEESFSRASKILLSQFKRLCVEHHNHLLTKTRTKAVVCHSATSITVSHMHMN